MPNGEEQRTKIKQSKHSSALGILDGRQWHTTRIRAGALCAARLCRPWQGLIADPCGLGVTGQISTAGPYSSVPHDEVNREQDIKTTCHSWPVTWTHSRLLGVKGGLGSDAVTGDRFLAVMQNQTEVSGFWE